MAAQADIGDLDSVRAAVVKAAGVLGHWRPFIGRSRRPSMTSIVRMHHGLRPAVAGIGVPGPYGLARERTPVG
jgi:hypothetical protein